MTKEIADAGTRSTKAGKALDRMRARAAQVVAAATSAAAGPSWPTAPGTGGRARSQRRLGRTAAWRWRSRAACNAVRAWPTPVAGYHRRAAGTHGRHRSRGAGHGEASGRDGRHTQGEA